MSWTMKGLHLIFIALVLSGDAHGFSVWNGTSAVDWQAELSNVQGNQNVDLPTPVQAFKLLARRGANVKGRSRVHLSSAVQAGEHDPSFVQSSGDVSLLYAQGQGSPTIQQHMLTSGPSRLYSFESLDPGNYGRLVSQLQSTDNANLAYGSQNQSSEQSMANPSTENQLAVPQFLEVSHPSQTSGWYSVFVGQVSTSPSQLSGYQTQPSYQPSTTTHVSEGHPAVVHPQSLGASFPSQTSGRYSVFPGQVSTSPSQLSGYQTQPSYQPSTTTHVSEGHPAVVHPQSLGASYPSQTSGRYSVFPGQVSTSPSQLSGYQTQPSYQPSTTTHVSEGHPAVVHPQSLVASYPSQTSGRYPIFPGQVSTSPSQVFGFQTQPSYQPSTTHVSVGQSASIAQAQTSGASTLSEGLNSGRYLTLMGQTIPSSSQLSVPVTLVSAGQPAVVHAQSLWASYPSKISGRYVNFQGLSSPSSQVPASQTQSWYQPSTATPVLSGQSVVSKSQFLGASYPSQSSGRYTVPQGQLSPSNSQVIRNQTQTSNQPSYATQVLTGQSTSTPQLQFSDASTVFAWQASKRNNSWYQRVPSSIQSGVLANQIHGSQTPSAYQPSIPPQISRGRSSIAQAPFRSRAESSENAKWYTMRPQTISTSFPLVGAANLLSGFQTRLNKARSASQLLAGQSTITESLGASNSYPSQTSGRNTTLQGQLRLTRLLGFQIQSSHQPSPAWFSADQSASTAQTQSSASLLNQGSPSTRYLTSLAQSSPFASQSAATSNQAYGSQTSTNQPFASFLPGRLASTAAA